MFSVRVRTCTLVFLFFVVLAIPASAQQTGSIQGKVAGVSVTPSGQPGSGTNILLRSPTSISKSTSPLIVVDGVILSQSFEGSSADLESMDIESVEVVKGAAAASLYGSRAASGVIQIRTRSSGRGLKSQRVTLSGGHLASTTTVVVAIPVGTWGSTLPESHIRPWRLPHVETSLQAT